MRKRGVAYRALLLAPAVLVLLLVAVISESGLRYRRFGARAVVDPLSYMPPQYRPVDCLRSGPEGEPLMPSCRMRYKGVDVITNSRGLNDREVDERNPHFRIAVLGDSYTMAAGVAQREVFHGLLEDRLNRELGTPGFVELYNFARGGRSTIEELADLEAAMALLPLDAVIVGVTANNLLANSAGSRPCRPGDQPWVMNDSERGFYERCILGKSGTFLFLRGIEAKAGLWSFQHLSELARGITRRRCAQGDEGVIRPALERKARRLFEGCVGQFRELADAGGVELAWIMLSYAPERDAEILLEVLRASGERSVSMLDAHEQFESLESMHIYPGDRHPNATVHRIFADRIYDHLGAIGWLSRIRATHSERLLEQP